MRVERRFGDPGGSRLPSADWREVCLVSVSVSDRACGIVPELACREPSVCCSPSGSLCSFQAKSATVYSYIAECEVPRVTAARY